MEMDYDLLNIEASLSDGPAMESSSPEAEPVVEPAPSSAPEATQAPQPVQDDFDDTTPLTPREKMLLERLERMTGENLAHTAAKPAESTPAQQAIVARNFMEGLDINDVLATSENLNELLSAVYTAAMEESSKLSAEQILQNLPSIMSQYVTQHMTMTKLVDDFYAANPDLATVKQTVSSVANKIAAEHPDWTTDQVFEASAEETRSLLRIRAMAPGTPQTSRASGQRPAFAPATSRRLREKAPTLSKMEQDVLDLVT